ncbi:MAG: hypothetical protein AAFO07_19425 [Bacteroidota bacterium]
MKHSKYLVLSIVLLTVFSCKSQRYTADNLPSRQVIFGSSGGYTGATTYYIVLENGQLFKHSSLEGTTVELKRIKKKQARKIFAAVDAIDLDAVERGRAVNYSQFMEVKDSTGTERFIWDPKAGIEMDTTITNMYQEFIKNLDKKKKKN